MSNFPFNALPLESRTRLVEMLHQPDGPQGPVASTRSRGVGTMIWCTPLVLGALGGLGWLMVVDFGRISEPFEPAWLLVGYFGLLGFALALGLGLVQVVLNRRRLPVAPGDYLLPRAIVRVSEMMDQTITVERLDQVVDVRITHRYQNGIYQATDLSFVRGEGKPASFTVRGEALSRTVLETWFLRAQQCARQAGAPLADRLVEDPFAPLHLLRGGWDDLDPATPKPDSGPGVEPFRGVLAWPGRAALVLGMAGAVVLWAGRNEGSDYAAWKSALSEGRREPIERYLRNGHRWLAEAQAALPGYALAEAIHANQVQRIRAVLAEFPDPALAVTAGEPLARLHAEARAQVAARLASPLPPAPTTLANLPDPTPADDARLEQAIRALIDWQEAHGTTALPLVLRLPNGSDLTQAETELKGLVAIQAPQAKVAPLGLAFALDANKVRRQQIRDTLDHALGTILPQGVVALKPVDRLPEEDFPGLGVVATVKPSGSVYVSSDKTTAAGGLEVHFELLLQVPGHKDVVIDTTVHPPDHFTVGTTWGQRTRPDAFQIYDTMAVRAFDAYAAALCRRFHVPPPPAQAAPGSRWW